MGVGENVVWGMGKEVGGKGDGLEKEEGKVEVVEKDGEKEGAEEKETENTAGFGNIEAELGTENPWNQSIKKNQTTNKSKNTERSTNQKIQNDQQINQSVNQSYQYRSLYLLVNEKNCY